jgi:hypothetical protein
MLLARGQQCGSAAKACLASGFQLLLAGKACEVPLPATVCFLGTAAAPPPPAATPPPQLLEAQAELDALRDAAASREAELRGAVAALRREKRELEARAAGVDLRQCEVRRAGIRRGGGRPAWGLRVQGRS